MILLQPPNQPREMAPKALRGRLRPARQSILRNPPRHKAHRAHPQGRYHSYDVIQSGGSERMDRSTTIAGAAVFHFSLNTTATTPTLAVPTVVLSTKRWPLPLMGNETMRLQAADITL
ncbi:unnamed protein product [Zymoseptoria tritici ST99CH_3D7]|uniref:Uncharacterized protein n=1 Tax=Zymoseptoria tritici (strain ST99CH_3D7) TaxID=1276538 RepID=A0A1X7S5Y2_ZYMT9|nr:unnamed protein product [Zymoseptoria tritici ST99CH_3D7]